MAENKTREELFIDKFNEKNNEDIKAELDKLQAAEVIKNAKVAAVENMLRDRAVVYQSNFTEKGVKQAGFSSGYIAQEEKTGNIFILKQFYKTHNEALKIQDLQQRNQAIEDRISGVQELIGSTMYQFLLYNQAPKEGLVASDNSNQNSLYVRSKFFNNVVQLAEFSGVTNGATAVKAANTNLRKLKGFEKVIAACHMLGELDYHAGNLMVQDGKTVNKIDHGKSFMSFNQDFGAMVQSTAAMFSHPGIGYEDAIKLGNLSFSIDKYSESLNQMLNQFGETQVAEIVDQKIDELKKFGFDPQDLPLSRHFRIKNFDDLRRHYKDNIRENLVNMQEVSKGAGIVKKFSNVSPEFKNGRWLEMFAHTPVKDPVIYAITNNIQIEGKNAQDWAYENKYQIKVSKFSKKEKVKEQQWQKNSKGKWQQQEVSVIKDTNIIQSLDPVIVITQMYNHNQDQIVAKEVESLIYDFTLKIVDKKTSGKEITEFYDQIISKLKKEQYLTDQDVNIIKNDANYKKNIEDTSKLINITTPDLTIKDKVYYKMANFCKKIGLSTMSNHLVEKISPYNLSKLYEIENIIEAGIKIGDTLKSQGNKAGQAQRLEEVKKLTQHKLSDRTRGKNLQTRL